MAAVNDEQDVLLVWLDSALLILGSFVLIAFIYAMLANPNKTPPTPDEILKPEGVIVEIRWPDGMDSDVDLWVQAPGDVAVGYSVKQGRVFNLLRDDLGHYNDGLGNLRYESAYTRGIPAGEYTVNVGAYRNAAKFPIPVQVKVTVKFKDTVREIGSTTVSLTKISQEITAMRFTLDANHSYVQGSMNHFYKPLWLGTKQ